MHRLVLAVLALASPIAVRADDSSKAEPPITVTINPEGRVSVVLSGALPPPVSRGTPVELAVKVINQGFSTGMLEARLVGDPLPGATLDFHAERLKGSPRETRLVRITLTNPAPTDLTIAFRLANEAPDLGGRDRIHLLIRPL